MIGDHPCGIYLPGHRVHYIQARKASGERGEPAAVLEATESTIVLAVAGGLRVYGNHDPRRLLLLAQGHPEVMLIERWHMLRIGGGSVRRLFSLVKDGPPDQPCSAGL